MPIRQTPSASYNLHTWIHAHPCNLRIAVIVPNTVQETQKAKRSLHVSGHALSLRGCRQSEQELIPTNQIKSSQTLFSTHTPLGDRGPTCLGAKSFIGLAPFSKFACLSEPTSPNIRIWVCDLLPTSLIHRSTIHITAYKLSRRFLDKIWYVSLSYPHQIHGADP